MPTYAGSLLAVTGKVTGGEKRAARRALDKRIRTALNEKLIMEVEMSIPQDVTDIRADKQRVAEVVVKLIRKLKEGPLMEAKTDEQWLNSAIKFLVTNAGKAWIRSWFQLHTVENSIPSDVPTAIAGTIKAKSTSQEISQHEGQGDLSNASGTQHLDASIGLMPILPTSDQGFSGSMPRGTIPPTFQLLEFPAGTVPYPPASEGSAAGMEPLQSFLDSTSIQASAPEAALSSASANEVVRALAQLDPGTSKHQRSYSDPGQVHTCLICYKFHWMSNGSLHPAVFPLPEATPTIGDMRVQQATRNESWAVWITMHVLTPVHAVAWSLLCLFLVQLSENYLMN